MNTQDQKRVMVLNRILDGQVSTAEAAALLKLSKRQVQRILAAYRKEGAATLVHGNRGRSPIHRIKEETRQQILRLAQTTYVGANQQHLRDLLEEREGIVVSRATVRRIVQPAGSPQRKPPQHRRRRKRYAQEGMLVQIDGSPHAWLEERGPRLHLLAAIDDATGKVLAAIFREQEDRVGYFQLVEQLVTRYGRPLAFYHDRHEIFPKQRAVSEADSLEEQLAGRKTPSQFGRLLEELEITSIAAHSPQAKGRVERLFGTLQDRLVIELRLAGATTREQANAHLADYLPRFNAQFAVPAAQEGSAYRAVAATFKPEEVYCFKYERVVAADNTVQFGQQRLQVLAGQVRRSYAHVTVEVHERFDGSLAIFYAGVCLASTPASLEAPQLRARGKRLRLSLMPASTSTPAEPPAPAEVQTHKPPASSKPRADHPWRK
ncbi:MAG TPA: ISNCY family transposase [Ktedonobacteraceae bacterium]|nr:ISNCY family transposase [Ktedonobacteraceae bacterium]